MRLTIPAADYTTIMLVLADYLDRQGSSQDAGSSELTDRADRVPGLDPLLTKEGSVVTQAGVEPDQACHGVQEAVCHSKLPLYRVGHLRSAFNSFS